LDGVISDREVTMPLADSILGDQPVQFPDCGELPGWALAYADAALRCGQTTTQIEDHLVKRGLTTCLAREVVPKCLELRLQALEQAKKRAVTWRWINRVAYLVVLVAYIVAWRVAQYTVDLDVRVVIHYCRFMVIPAIYFTLCELIGRNYTLFSRKVTVARLIVLAIAGWLLFVGTPAVIFALEVWGNSP
jgi:hypothetical protein